MEPTIALTLNVNDADTPDRITTEIPPNSTIVHFWLDHESGEMTIVYRPGSPLDNTQRS